MKKKISISMEEDTIGQIQKILPESIFRNQSHFIETATKKYLSEVKNGRK